MSRLFCSLFGKKPGLKTVLAAGISLWCAASPMPALAQLTTLYRFSGGTDGRDPNALALAGDGSFYGTTVEGGNDNNGVVFRLPAGGGGINVLYRFTNGPDGSGPNALIQATDGNFYGTTYSGGTGDGFGTVFRLTPAGNLTTLYSFTGNPDTNDGANPYSRLLQASDGNLYGTTYRGGGEMDNGTVFRISTGGGLTTLYTFTGTGDGGSPFAGLIQGRDGNFYGTTGFGGDLGLGTVFRITPGGALTTLHSFNGASTGANPYAELVQAGDGNFYGTTFAGGASNRGTLFRLTPGGQLTTLYSFTGGQDGSGPLGALQADASGNLYGTTSRGGASNQGTVFRAPTAGGAPTVLYSFSGGPDGRQPKVALVPGRDGALYGTTGPGSVDSAGGTLFRLEAALHPPFFAGEVPLSNGVYFLQFAASGNVFGYYTYAFFPYLYHFDLGFVYFVDAQDSARGAFLYDFTSSSWFYTSPSFPFPYLYDFSLNALLYYYPNTSNPGTYTKNPRYFFNFRTNQIITK